MLAQRTLGLLEWVRFVSKDSTSRAIRLSLVVKLSEGFNMWLCFVFELISFSLLGRDWTVVDLKLSLSAVRAVLGASTWSLGSQSILIVFRFGISPTCYDKM